MKHILDACCGGRLFWFNKKHPDTIYVDIRRAPAGFSKDRKNFSVEPDVIADFRALPFPDKRFKHIVWDPPHLLDLQATSIMQRKYGTLFTETWAYDLGKGFDELWRVLDDYGTLVFKWSDSVISLEKVLSCFKEQPLYGHPTMTGNTYWVVFFKNPHSSSVSQS